MKFSSINNDLGLDRNTLFKEGDRPDECAATIKKEMTVEIIDSRELARRWNLPESWIRDNVRRRSTDVIPHMRFGRYVRFEFGSEELQKWLRRRKVSSNGRTETSRKGGKG